MLRPSSGSPRQSTVTAATRFVALDGWRGVCALLVALHHFVTAGTISASAFVQNANLFVDFFFVLSGFVIAHSYGHRIRSVAGAGAFLVKRIGRVWPLHVAMLILLIGLEAARGAMGAGVARAPFTAPDAAASILPNLLLLQSFGLVDGLSWNVPSWSISVEFAAYLMFASGTLVFRGMLVGVGCAIIAVSVAALAISPGQYVDDTQVMGLFRGFLGFFVGVLVYETRLQLARPLFPISPALSSGLELVAVGAVIFFVSVADKGMLPLTAPFLFGLTVLVFSFEGGILSSALLSPVARRLGRLSYSIYMVHYVLLLVLGAVLTVVDHRYGIGIVSDQPHTGPGLKVFDFGSSWRSDLASVVFLLAVLSVAPITYRMIEIPGQAAFNKLVQARQPVRTLSGEA